MMKKSVLFILAMVLFVATSNAQSLKFAIVEADAIVALMPETDSARVKMEAHAATLRGEFETMQSDYQKKLEAYNKNVSQYSAAMKQQKEKELQDVQTTLREYNQIAGQDMQQKQQELMMPILEKINISIKKVCKANGYHFVMDKAQPAFVYFDEAVVTDITPLVKKDIGV